MASLRLQTRFFCSVLIYPNGEEAKNELSLVIRHAINYFVGIFDLAGLSDLSGYNKKQNKN
jgi:hypothetical protein